MAKGTRGSIWQVKGTDHKYKCISLLHVNSKTRIVVDASPVGLGVVLIHL